MRIPVIISLVLLVTGVAPVAIATATEMAAPLRPELYFGDEEDDPKLARLLLRGGWLPEIEAPEHYAPTVKFTYRGGVKARDLDGSDLPFNILQFDMYPLSMRWVRVGADLDIGIGAGKTSAYFVTTGFSAGLQYPWRITPFIDAHVNAGLMFGDVAGKTALTYTWWTGIDVGAEVYLVDRLFLSLAFGWVHLVYHGVDVAHAAAVPGDSPVYRDISSDSFFTVKVGLGL